MDYRKGQYKIPVTFIDDLDTKPFNCSKYNNQPDKKEPEYDLDNEKIGVNLEWETRRYNNTSDPSVWGPALWFSFHLSASKYPESAGCIQRTQMKAIILGIPVLLACTACKEHAHCYIKKTKDDNKLDDIVSGQVKLFNWFVDFHNAVNERLKKRIITYEEASKMYYNDILVSNLVYK
jgi:hypothetical protein